ncbi:molybdate metabolism regulator, partial [Actinoplanes philippinensis]
LAALAETWMLLRRPSALVSLADALGAEAGPALFHFVDQDVAEVLGVEGRRRVLEVLSMLPSDEVMRGLLSRVTGRDVKPVLIETAGRFPARAVRILAESSPAQPAVADLLRLHVLTHRDLAQRVAAELAPEAADRVRAVIDAADAVVTAPLSQVPPVLADPPWLRRTKPAKPPVVTGLTCPDAAAVAWLPGEREEFAATPLRFFHHVTDDWPAVAAKVAAGSACLWEPDQLFTLAPEEIARPALVHWRPQPSWNAEVWMRVTAARYETDALHGLVAVARERPADYGPLLLPFTSPEVAELIADWLARLKSMRRLAQTWLARHPPAAARALNPPAQGRS